MRGLRFEGYSVTAVSDDGVALTAAEGDLPDVVGLVREVVEGLGGTVWATARTDGPGAAVGFELPVPDPT